MNATALFRVKAGVFVGLLLSTLGGCTREAPKPKSKPFVAPKSQQEANDRLFRALRDGYGFTETTDAQYTRELNNLLDAGADPNAVTRATNYSPGQMPVTPLLQAVRYGRLDLIELLLAKGAKVNFESVEPLLGAALRSATFEPDDRKRSYAMASFLVEKGADVNRRIWDGLPNQSTFPLHVAVNEKRSEFVQLMLEHGADVNARDGSGQTPLDIAEAAKSAELVDMLKAKAGLRGNELPKQDNKP